MVSIYILKLEKNKYYVGKTKDAAKRTLQHFQGNGAVWTQKYRPISVVEIHNNCVDEDEDKYVKIYMKKYGINSVRGGSYTSIVLSELQEAALNMELLGNSGCCFRCMRKGHFANKCYARTYVDGSPIDDDESDYEEVWICEYCNKGFTTEREAEKHERFCKKKEKETACFRCGRTGHYANECYARTNVAGSKIYNRH